MFEVCALMNCVNSFGNIALHKTQMRTKKYPLNVETGSEGKLKGIRVSSKYLALCPHLRCAMCNGAETIVNTSH